jgi:hypothetical protein
MKLKTISIIAIACLLSACNNNPKVITSSNEADETNKSSGIFSGESSNDVPSKQNATLSNDLHTIVVNEVLPTEKYVYLNVNEGDDKFWIATRKVDVKVGNTYYYKGGLLKTNFESKEYNRVFEKVYLISSLVESNHGNNSGVLNTNKTSVTNQKAPAKAKIETHAEKIVQHKGSIKIAELVKDPKKYEGKTVQLTGICTKINAGIMDRNWIHLKDGSKDDFDLVITSDAYVPEGKTVTIKALVTLNKDFGAGYSYDLILENGTVIK